MRIKNIGMKSVRAWNNSNTECVWIVGLVLMMRRRSSMTEASNDANVIRVTNALNDSSDKTPFSKQSIGRHSANLCLSMSVLIRLFKYDDMIDV